MSFSPVSSKEARLGAWIRWPIQYPINQPTMASTIALIRLKPIRRCHIGRLGVLTATNSSTSMLGVREVLLGIRRQQLGGRREAALLLGDPGGELRPGHDCAGVEHVSVPDAAQFRAMDVERQ